jgi:hypothetical protein
LKCVWGDQNLMEVGGKESLLLGRDGPLRGGRGREDWKIGEGTGRCGEGMGGGREDWKMIGKGIGG